MTTSLLTYVLSSLAWSGVGFALGLAVGRVARDDIDGIESADPEVAARRRRRIETVQLVGVIVVLLAISTVSSGIYGAYQARAQRECFSAALEARSAASRSDFESVDRMFNTLVTTVLVTRDPDLLRQNLRSALNAYEAERARTDEVRDANPITTDSC